MINQGLYLWTPLGSTVPNPLTYLSCQNKLTPNRPSNPNSNAASKMLPRKVHTIPSLLQDKILNYNRHCQ